VFLTDAFRIESFVLSIRDSSGREFLTWADPVYPRDMPRYGIFGCFGGPSDPDPTRAVGATFRLRVTYTVRGDTRAVEVTGPITSGI
jgi:hypothetical protein